MTAAHLIEPVGTIRIASRRFGELILPQDELIDFPAGLPGFEALTRFVLLPVRPGLAWLQSADRGEISFLVVEPGCVEGGAWADLPHAWAVVTLGSAQQPATANLVAPIRIDPATRIGRQEIRPESGFGTTHPFELPLG